MKTLCRHFAFIFALLCIVATAAGCSSNDVDFATVKNALVAEIKNTLLEQGGYTEADLAGEEIPGYICGSLQELEGQAALPSLDQESIVNSFFMQNLMNVNSNVVILLEAENEQQAAQLKDSLKDFHQTQVDIWQRYLPDQYEKVQANITATKGKYVYYITFDRPADLEQAILDVL